MEIAIAVTTHALALEATSDAQFVQCLASLWLVWIRQATPSLSRMVFHALAMTRLMENTVASAALTPPRRVQISSASRQLTITLSYTRTTSAMSVETPCTEE
jgi:hypothetical protein